MTPPADPFDVLSLPARFDLDPGDIERAYLSRAAGIHPDLAGADPEKASEAARRSAALNDARATLVDPESRAHALLERLGGAEGTSKDLPDGFLMEIMETRMELEAAIAGGDAAEVARWREWGRDQRAAAIEKVGTMFADLADPPAKDILAEIRRRLNAWRYIERLLEQIDA